MSYLFVTIFYILLPISAIKGINQISPSGLLILAFVPWIFSIPYFVYAFGAFSLKKRGRIVLFYSIMPVFLILFLILNEIFENAPFRYGGLCTEGAWCWLIGDLIIYLIAIISLIVGIIRFIIYRKNEVE